MKKIPTLFERDWNGNKSLVLDGPSTTDISGATPTIKWDGTCCMIRSRKLYKRYDAKAGRTPPSGFELVECDETTGHTIGWVPVGDGPDDRWFREAFNGESDGTYELCGPKVQGNPQHLPSHKLIRHGAEVLCSVPHSFLELKEYLRSARFEGIVWWKDGSPIAKLKRRDFGFSWPIVEVATE